MSHDLLQDFRLLRETAKEAAALALSFYGRTITKHRKADGTAVTEADYAVDALLAARLRQARPEYGWLSEESAEQHMRLEAQRVWVLDPIDGTRAFIQGRDDWTIALALVERGVPVLAVVVNPVRGETFEAQAGKGAFRNGEMITVSAQSEVNSARIVVPEALLSNKRWRSPWPPVTRVWANSMIYRLALVASAQADTTFAITPKWEWDVAAGALLVQEAGGTMTDRFGKQLRFNSTEAKVQGYLAAGKKLHHKVLEHLNGFLESPAA